MKRFYKILSTHFIGWQKCLLFFSINICFLTLPAEGKDIVVLFDFSGSFIPYRASDQNVRQRAFNKIKSFSQEIIYLINGDMKSLKETAFKEDNWREVVPWREPSSLIERDTNLFLISFGAPNPENCLDEEPFPSDQIDLGSSPTMVKNLGEFLPSIYRLHYDQKLYKSHWSYISLAQWQGFEAWSKHKASQEDYKGSTSQNEYYEVMLFDGEEDRGGKCEKDPFLIQREESWDQHLTREIKGIFNKRNTFLRLNLVKVKRESELDIPNPAPSPTPTPKTSIGEPTPKPTVSTGEPTSIPTEAPTPNSGKTPSPTPTASETNQENEENKINYNSQSTIVVGQSSEKVENPAYKWYLWGILILVLWMICGILFFKNRIQKTERKKKKEEGNEHQSSEESSKTGQGEENKNDNLILKRKKSNQNVNNKNQ